MKPITRKKLVIIAGVCAGILLAGMLTTFNLRQATAVDYKRLDTQRQIVDISMNIYNPLFDGFSTEYNNVHAEERSAEEKAQVKSAYVTTLEQERKLNADRLKSMSKSIALREPTVKKAFEAYNGRYGAIVDYYNQYTINIGNITESVAGPCAALSKLNVATQDYAANYTKAADRCLAALATAKKTSNSTSKTLLAEIESLITERRDAFGKVAGKQDFEKDVASITALLTILDVNSDLKVIQAKYETETKTIYTKLVDDANEANKELEAALKPFVTSETTKESRG